MVKRLAEKVSKLVPDAFRRKLEDEIALIEKESSVEIVPVFLKASSSYVGFRRFYSLILFILLLLVERLFHLAPASILLEWGIPLLFSMGAFFYWEYYPEHLVPLVPQGQRWAKVQRRAREAFFEHEVFNTRARSGILIYVSFLEKSVLLLADKGFQAHIPEKVWMELSEQLAADFDAENPGHSFLRALDSFRGKFAQSFPRSENDRNELHDKLRD
jgi:putative membrane protein